MGKRERLLLAAAVAAIAVYAFGVKGLLLCVVAGLVYLVARPGRRPHHS
jgi:small-conductance mechanosensitive channel